MPVRTGIETIIRLDSVFQRYNGRCPPPGSGVRGNEGRGSLLCFNDYLIYCELTVVHFQLGSKLRTKSRWAIR